MEAVVVAVIVGVISPALLAGVSNRNRRKERLADYARQDEVASRVEAAASITAERAQLLVASNERVAREAKSAAERTAMKLDGIHLLVDGRYTAEMRRGLVAMRGQLVLMRRLFALQVQVGEAVTPEDRNAEDAVVSMIAAMEEEIAARVALAGSPPSE